MRVDAVSRGREVGKTTRVREPTDTGDRRCRPEWVGDLDVPVRRRVGFEALRAGLVLMETDGRGRSASVS